MTIKERLKGLVEGAYASALDQKLAPENLKVVIERPRLAEHGDFACGVALSASSGSTKEALAIANIIVDNLKAVPKDVCSIYAVSPGFVNFNLGPYWLCQALCEIHKASEGFSPSAREGKIDSSVLASKQNSSFYIQYMHAKLSTYLRLALEPKINQQSCLIEPAIINPQQWSHLLQSYQEQPLAFKALFHSKASIFIEQKALVLHLDSLPEQLSLMSKNKGAECITDYAYELALKLERLFAVCRLITDSEDVTKSYLGLIVAAKRVLAHALGIIGLEAPEAI